MSKFENKKAIVIGGTSGIGLAASNMLAVEGATVITASRSADDSHTPCVST